MPLNNPIKLIGWENKHTEKGKSTLNKCKSIIQTRLGWKIKKKKKTKKRRRKPI